MFYIGGMQKWAETFHWEKLTCQWVLWMSCLTWFLSLLIDDSGSLLPNDSQPPLLVVNHHSAYISTSGQPASEQHILAPNLTTDATDGVFDCQVLASGANNMAASSPRIEITPSGDSFNSRNLELSPGSKGLAYRDCISPASSNSSTGWPAEACSPLTSPCVSPPNGSTYGISLPALDLCPGLQSIHTSSAHSSPGPSPRNSVTDETFLQPHRQRSASPLPHQRSRSTSPQGKRSFDPSHSSQGGTPVKQRSRSPSPIPSPHEQQRTYGLNQYQAQAEFQPQTQGLAEILSGLSANLSGTVHPAVQRGTLSQAPRQECAYGDAGYDWAIGHEKLNRSGPELKSETFYMVPSVWPATQPVHSIERPTFRYFVCLTSSQQA